MVSQLWWDLQFFEHFCKTNLADVIANVYWLYGRCCCQLCLILYHQSDVIDWWLVVMLPLLRFIWLILLPCGDVVTTCWILFGWCYCQCWGCCYCHFVWFMADVVPLLVYHWYGCCWWQQMLLPLVSYSLADVIANGWWYCQVADVVPLLIYKCLLVVDVITTLGVVGRCYSQVADGIATGQCLNFNSDVFL